MPKKKEKTARDYALEAKKKHDKEMRTKKTKWVPHPSGNGMIEVVVNE